VAEAGSPVNITLPQNTATLNGSASYDMTGKIVSYSWTYVGGPSTFIISGANSAIANLSGLMAGTYTFKLTVKDNDSLSAAAIVTITVNPAIHMPPVANAGKDITITLPVDTTTLNGSGSYDSGGVIKSYVWTLISGPTAYTLVGSNVVQASLSGLVAGTYTFQLTVTDNYGISSSSTVTVTVKPEPEIPPVANAGADTSITLPADSAYLDGRSSYSPVGKIISYQWQELAGPMQYQIENASASLSLVNGLVAGNYLFELTVTGDNGLQSTSKVQVTVNLNANIVNGQVEIYPNPVLSHATVYFYNNDEGKVIVNIFDLNGRLQHTYNFIKDHLAVFKENIDFSNLPSGMYFVQVMFNSSFSTTLKVEKLTN